MTAFFDKLNLRPQERRLVVVIAVIVFVVLNVVWVRPHFSDLKNIRTSLDTAKATIVDYQDKINKNNDPKNGYAVVLKNLERTNGPVSDNAAIQLQTTIMTQAAAANVTVGSYSPVNTAAAAGDTNNLGFVEQSIRITVDSAEKELVDFLVAIGGDNSMIRVRELSLRPSDQNRYRLRGDLTLYASYRKQPVKEVAPPKPLPASARKPAMVPGTQKPTK